MTFGKLGGKCVKCGYDKDHRALNLDHVRGDGHKERDRRNSTYYRRAFEDKTGKYQLLCCNCNILKAYKNDER